MGQEWWGGDGDTRQCPDNRRSDSSPCASWDVGKGRAAFALASSVSCVSTVVWSDSRDRWNGDHECGFYLGVTLPAKHTCVQRQLTTQVWDTGRRPGASGRLLDIIIHLCESS